MDNNNLHIVNTHGNGRLSESSPDLTSSSILDSNHNAINLNKTDESVSSSSSVEPRSESSLTDPIRSINKDEDGNFGSFYHDDVANDNIEADRESVLSDFISSHMVPLPHISAEPASEEDEDEEDYISVASSRDANWEDNWLFKKKKSNKTSSSSVGMLVPAPKEDIRALIGDKPTDEVSDLSEIGSDTDDSSLEMISASLEPLNDRLVNKHLIGGKNTKIVLDELVDRTSMISTSSLPDNEPPYTETKNEFVVSNDGLNESQSLKISVNNCNKAISNEAINSNVTKTIPAKVEKLTKEGQVTEDESIIVPPPNDFTDDEKMRNLLAKFNEEQHNKTDSGDDNSSSMSPRSSISCALSAGIERAELDAYEGITDFSVEDEEGPASEIDPEMAESSSRRPSVIEILAAIALGPMLAVSASDDRNILTELELSSLMELNELAMAQMSAKTNEERRLGVIAEESFDIGPGDDHKTESIECNEEADLLSSPKMVMDAIRELVGKDLMRSEQNEESSIQIEEITDDSINTEEIAQQNILNDPAESIKNSTQTNQEQLQIEETFEIVPVEHEIKEDIQQGQSETKMADSELEQSHIHVIKSNDDDNGITMNSLSEDFGFEKVIPDDTSSISDESLHTIGSSSEYSEDLDGDTTSFFIDEHKISVIAEMSTDQKLQEKIEENQSSASDRTVNEFILPPPIAFCDKESRKHDEDGSGSEKDQVIEAHIISETIEDINQITSENSDNEIEKTATDEETHNEKPCTETEVIENTESIPKTEIVEILTSETNKSDEPPDKVALDNTLSKTDAELLSSIEKVQSESIIDSEIEDETKCKQNVVEISQEKVFTNIGELAEEIIEEKSEQIIVEQTAPAVTNEPAALKTLSEAQLALLELNSKILNVEESIIAINSQQITGKIFNDSQEVEEIKDLSTPEELTHKKQYANNEANEIFEEKSPSSADEISEVQPVEESKNEKNIILEDKIAENISESLNNNSASEVIDLVELKHQQTTKKQSEEPVFEETNQENATETTTTEDRRVLVDGTLKTEFEENPEAEGLSSKVKSIELTENLKTEETESKFIEEKGNGVIVEEIVPLIETSSDSQKIGELHKTSSSQPSVEKTSEDVLVETIPDKEDEICPYKNQTEPIKEAQIDDINTKLSNEHSAEVISMATSESEPKIEDSFVGDNLVPEESSEVFSKQLLEEVENAFKSQSNKQDTEEDEQSQKKLISQEQEAIDEEIANTLDSDTKLLATNVEEPIPSDRKEDSGKTSSETIENEKKPANEETPIQTESSNLEEPKTADIDETKNQNEDEQASILDLTDGGNMSEIESFPIDTLNDTTNLENNPDSHIQTIDPVVIEGSQSEITLTVQASLEPSNEEPSETNAIQNLKSHKAEVVNNISQNDSKASDRSSDTSIEEKPTESVTLLLNQDDIIAVTENSELESTENVNDQQSELSKELSTEDLPDIGVVEKEGKETSEIGNSQVKLHDVEVEKSPVTLSEAMNVDETNLDKDEQKCEEILFPIQEKEVLIDATNNNLEDHQSQNIQITDNKTDDDKQVEIENSNLTDHENITSNEENPDNQVQEKSAVETGTTDLLSTPSNEEVKKAEKAENIAEESLEVSTTTITKKSDSITGEANDEDANDLKEGHPIEISENLKVEEEQMQQTEIGGVKKPLDDLESQLKSETNTSSQITCAEKIEAVSTVQISDSESMNTGIVQGETKEKEETLGELKDKLVEDIKESSCNDMQIESVDVEQLEKDAKDFNAYTLEALPSNDEQDLTEPNAEKSMLVNDDISTEPIKIESVADTEEQCVALSPEETVQKIKSSETNTEQIQMKVVTTDSKTEISTQTIACEDPTIEPADTVSSVEDSVTDLKIEGPVPMPTGNNEETDATSATGSKFEVKVEVPEEKALTGENKEPSATDVVAKETKVEHIQIELVTTDSKTEVSTQTNACEDPTNEPVDLKSDTVSSVENSVTDLKIEEPVTMSKGYNEETDAVKVKVEIPEENALTVENKESSTADIVTNETKIHIQMADLDSNQKITEFENPQQNSEVQSEIENSESTEKISDQNTVKNVSYTDPEAVEPEIEISKIKNSQIEESDKEENTPKSNDQTLILEEDSRLTEISSDKIESRETNQINTELEQAKETEESHCNTGTFISEEKISTEDISEKKKNHTVRQNAIEEQPENNSMESKVEDNIQTTDDRGIQTLTSEEPIAAKDCAVEQGSEESKQVPTESNEDVEKIAEHHEEGTFIPVDEPKEELPENKSDETVSTDEISGKEELTKVEGIIEEIDKLNQESGQICQEPGLHKDLQEEIPDEDEKVVVEDKSSEAQKSEETEAKVIALDAPVQESTSLSSPIDSEDISSLKNEIEKKGELVSESTSSAENKEEVIKENENINKTVLVEENAEESICEDTPEQLTLGQDTEDIKDAPIPIPEVQSSNKEVEVETQNCVLVDDLTLSTDDEKIRSILSESELTLKTDDEKIEDILVVKSKFAKEETAEQTAEEEISLNTQEPVPENKDLSVLLERVDDARKTATTLLDAIQKEVNSEIETTLSSETEPQTAIENNEEKIVKNETEPNIISDSEMITSNETVPKTPTESVKDINVENEVHPDEEVTLSNETESQIPTENVEDKAVQNEDSPDASTTVSNEIESSVSIEIVEDKEVAKEIISETETIVSNETETEVTTENVENKTIQDEVRPETESQTNIEKVEDQAVQNEGSPDANTTVPNEIESGVSIEIVEDKEVAKEIISQAETIISNGTESEIKVENVEDKTVQDEIRPGIESILSNETRDKAIKFESSNAETLSSNDTETEVTTENVEDKTTQDKVRPETESETNIDKVEDQEVQNEGNPDASTTVSNEIESGVSIQIVEDKENPKEIIPEAETNISNETESEVTEKNVEDEVRLATETTLLSETGDKAVQNGSSNAETLSSNDTETEETTENVEDKTTQDEERPETESQTIIEKVEDQEVQNEGNPDASMTVSNEIESGVCIQTVEDKEVPKEIISEAETIISNETESELKDENVEDKTVQDKIRPDTESILSSETRDRAVQNKSSNAETVSSNDTETEVTEENVEDKSIKDEVQPETESQINIEKVEDQVVQNEGSPDSSTTVSNEIEFGVSIQIVEDKEVPKEIITETEMNISNKTESEITKENVEDEVRLDTETTLSSETGDNAVQNQSSNAETVSSNNTDSEVTIENIDDKTIQGEVRSNTEIESQPHSENVEDQAVQNQDTIDTKATESDVTIQQFEDKLVQKEIILDPETIIPNETESEVIEENVEGKAVQGDVRPNAETTLSTEDKAPQIENPTAEAALSNDNESKVTTENVEDKTIQDEIPPETESQKNIDKVEDQAVQNEGSPDASTTVSNEIESGVSIQIVENKENPKEIISEAETIISNETESEVKDENIEDTTIQDEIPSETESQINMEKVEDQAVQNENSHDARMTVTNESKSDVSNEQVEDKVAPMEITSEPGTTISNTNVEDKAVQDDVRPDAETTLSSKTEDKALQNESSSAETTLSNDTESELTTENVKDNAIQDEAPLESESQICTKEVEDQATQNIYSSDAKTLVSKEIKSDVNIEEDEEKVIPKEIISKPETRISNETESEVTSEENVENKAVQDEVQPETETILLSKTESQITTENTTVRDEVRPDAATTLLSKSTSEVPTENVLPDSETTLLSETISQIPTETDVEMTVSETESVIIAENVEDKTEFLVTTENFKDEVVVKEIISNPENIVSSETVPEISIESVEIKAEHDELIPDVKKTVTNETESQISTENVEDKTVQNQVSLDVKTVVLDETKSEVIKENVEDKNEYEATVENSEDKTVENEIRTDSQTTISSSIESEIPTENVEDKAVQEDSPDVETVLSNKIEPENTVVLEEMITETETKISNETVPQTPPENVETKIGSDQSLPDSETTLPSENEIEVTTKKVEEKKVQKEIISEPETIISNETVPRIPIENVDDKTILNEESPEAEKTLSSETESKILTESIQGTKVSKELIPNGETTVLSETASRIGTDNVELKTVQNGGSLETETMVLNTTESNMSTDKIENIKVQEEVSPDAETIIPNENEPQKPTAIQEESSDVEKASTNNEMQVNLLTPSTADTPILEDNTVQLTQTKDDVKSSKPKESLSKSEVTQLISEIVQSDRVIEALDSEPEISKDDLESKDASVSIKERQDCLENAEVSLSEKDAEVSQTNNLEKLEETQSGACVENLTENIGIQCFEKEAESKDTTEQDSKADNLKADIIPKEQIDTTASNQVTHEFQSLDVKNSEDTTALDKEVFITKEPEIPGVIISTTEITVVEETNEISSIDHRNYSIDPTTQGEMILKNIKATETDTDTASMKEEAEIEESDVKNYEKTETEKLATELENQVSEKASSENMKEDSKLIDTTAAGTDNKENLSADISESQEIQTEVIEVQNEPVQRSETVSENEVNEEPPQSASFSTSEEISPEKKLHTKEKQENEPIIEETSEVTEAGESDKLNTPTKMIEETKDLTLQSQELNTDSKIDSVPDLYDISETNSEDSFQSAVEDVEIISDLENSTSISEITLKASEAVTLKELSEVCGIPNEIASIMTKNETEQKTAVSLSQNEPNKESNISETETTEGSFNILDDAATELTALPESTDLQKLDFIVTGAIAPSESKDIEKTSSVEETNITEAVSKAEGNQVKAEEIQNQETSLSEIELVSDGTESLISKQTDNLVGDVENVTVYSNSKLEPKDLTKVTEEKPEPKAQEVPEVVVAAEPKVQEIPEAVVPEPKNQVHNDSVQVEDLPTQIPLLESKDASMLSESEISIQKEESVSKEGFSISHDEVAEEVSEPIPNLSTELTVTKDSTASSNDKPNSSIVEEVPNKSITQRTIAENSEVVILGISDGKNIEVDSVSKEELSVSYEKTAEEVSEPIPSLSTLLTIPQDVPVNTNGKPNEEEVPNKSTTEALVAENSEVDILEISDGTTNTIKDTKVAEETIVVSTPQESVLDSKERFEVIEEIKSKEIVADPSKSLETTNDIEAVAALDTQNKPLEAEIVPEIISETEILQEESNKVSAKAEKIENTIPIKNSDEAQTSAEVISVTEIPESIKSDAPNENIQIQKTFDTSEEQSLKSISADIAMEDKLSETLTEQVAEVVEIPPIEVLTATCKIITHPPLEKTESLIESAQCLYDEISHQVLETSPEVNTPTLAEELRMAADRNDTKESSKSERVIPQSIACESRCFTPEPQPDESIASDSVVATEQPNAQDAAQGNHISQVAKQLIFAEQSAKKSKAKNSGSSKFRNLTLRDRRFLAELEKRRKQRELIQNYLDSLDYTDTQSYLNEDLYLFESKCSIERSPYSLFIEPSDYCIVGATSPSPIANTHFLNTNILFSDRISSESNCTDDSTTTVIDTFGSMESRSNSDSSGEEFSPDDSTDRDSSATATTANNSILTTTNKATNQSHIYSPPPPLPLQPQPELRTESACSKLLQTRTSTGGNEEHVDDDPLKHLVPGSIAEREYKKWYNAVDMPNNPYSVEALRRRLSGGLDRTLDLPNISPCNEDNPLQLSESPAPEAETKGQERDYSRYSRDYYINDAKQASGTTKKSPTSPPQVSSPTSTASSIELDERVKHNSQTVETTPVKEMCHKLEKQCRIEADIYLATPVQVIEDIEVPQAFADKKPIQTVGRTITTSLTTEAVSRLSSDTSSILTNESLTPSEDSDTIRIYDLKKQETRLVKETTQTTTITVPKSPEKKVRPTELDIMPTLAPPIATVSAKCSTPTSFKFLQPKRKLINPSQVLSIDQDSTPLTPSTPDKTVIEAEVAHAMPSVKALAKAFLMTSSTSSSDNKWRKARAKTPMQFFKPTTPTATPAAAAAAAGTAAVANINRGIQKQPEPVIPDTTSQGSEDATIASDLSSLETDPPSRIDGGDTLDEDRVVLSGCLRNNIAFFENLKNK